MSGTLTYLPPLPVFPLSPEYPEKSWSPNVYGAYEELCSLYESAYRKGLTILLTLEEYADAEHIPANWLEAATNSLVNLLNSLTEAMESSTQKEDSNIRSLHAVHIVTGIAASDNNRASTVLLSRTITLWCWEPVLRATQVTHNKDKDKGKRKQGQDSD
ncbi:hypothetical protein K435DRAFT_899383 [Dendrothele bispora CBS 962.96]|uniref:Uncharacterized protein n=1 Tax=Dendrothele bispora (strain CBS 962.96) TaxID=1314807 RepID=A0A4S8LYF8_DENBC|nr:hypothetical protein K435DRAFT_899383 [Dendrothele bispora CBS 962.96]